LNSPAAITHAGDGSGRLFITLVTGQILISDGQKILPIPFLDITSLVSAGGERGLFSVAFHPDYESNGFLFVDYTDTNGDTVIARYSVSEDPNIVDPDSAATLLAIPQPFANHNGGQLQFGPDGFLYIGTGDGGSGGDPLDNAQNLGTLLGKILRIDVNGDLPYGIPDSNPFIGNPEAGNEIWALGLRNPWRFSFDRLTGDLFIADVGQGDLEEVNYQPFGSQGAQNYGWRLLEGSQCFNPSSNCNNGSLTLPIIEYDHSLGCSITGGYRYRGNSNPGLWSLYLFGDLCTGRIWGARENPAGVWTATELLDTDLTISTFGEDEAGEIYVADFSSENGVVYHIVSVVDRTEVEGFVTRFYRQTLAREPDAPGLNGWVNALIDGTISGADAAFGFVFSQEFINRNTSNEEFVTILYRTFFDREPDTGGYNAWVNFLNSGGARAAVLDGFTHSFEFEILSGSFGINPFFS
jgi:glucose/arabinose dehydrogenase